MPLRRGWSGVVVVVTFKVSEELARLLTRHARSRGMSRSEVIREALIEYLRRQGYSRLPPALSPAPRHDPRSPSSR